MRSFRPSGAMAWSLVVALGVGCESVLDIEQPHRRPAPAGTAGVSGSGGGVGGHGGEAGSGDGGTGMAGTAGERAGASGKGGTAGVGSLGTAGRGGATSGGGGHGGEEPEGGMGGAEPECTEGKARCGGRSDKVPEICDDGRWVANEDENGGDACPLLCAAGKCTECEDGKKGCHGVDRQDCVDGSWTTRERCDDYCLAGACELAPSCSGGLECAGGVSCCRALEVPGGEFLRDYDGVDYTDSSFHASVNGFLLDKFEVTVGRLRNFVGAYDDIRLMESEGKATQIDEDTGWHEGYPMPANKADLLTMLADSVACTDSTWTDDPSLSTEVLPANCVTFPLAYAFCIWDGGRLPTEAEWNYAAAGGSEQRQWPWQEPLEQEPPTSAHAVYEQPPGLPIAVGSKPSGDGRWEHSDLEGNVLEWTLDFKAEPYPDDCDNCLNAVAAEYRVVRGSAYLSPVETLAVGFRGWEAATEERSSVYGFRCVHDIPIVK